MTAGIALACASLFDRPTSSIQAASPQAGVSIAGRDLIAKYCLGCHNERLHTAGLNLENVNFEDMSASDVVLEKVARKLRAGQMPPTGMPRPDAATMNAFVSSLETGLDRIAAAKPKAGRVGLHRLNRSEY